jgi:hypothetical protein
MRPDPAAAVTKWVGAQHATSLFTTSVTEAEMRYGLAILPLGRRRKQLEAAVDGLFREDLAGRILPFDSAAACAFASLAAQRRKVGRPISQLDAQIAGIALTRGATLATRNTTDFAMCGIELIDPWGRR